MSLLSIDELRALAEQRQYPSISLYAPMQKSGSEVQQNPIRFKNVIKQIELSLQEDERLQDFDRSTVLQLAMELDKDEFWQHQDEGLAIFLQDGFMRYYRVPLSVEELVVIGDRFHLKPLLPLLNDDGKFYLLALSQKQIRLFQCSRYSISEIELDDIPTSVKDALNYDETAKEGQFRISTSKGGTRNTFQQAGSFHGQGSPDRDHPKADILQFFHILNQSLQTYFEDKHIPLVLAGVEYLLPIYQEANTHPHLIDTILPVENVGILDSKHVHEQAWAAVEPFYNRAQDDAIAHYYELTGTGKTSTDLQEAVAAAYYGRVDQLFVAAGIQKWGHFDPQTSELQLHADPEPGDEDLLSTAAIETVLKGGTVYAVEPEKVPDQVPIAAVFRY